MKIYLVGGAVRDKLLDLSVKERDWVVVGATEQALLDQGFERLDTEFPVYLHPVSREEYALARRETKTGPGYKGFKVEAGPDVSLEEDLIRRDLTINAMAEDEQGRIIDPFNGQADLRDGLLRHVSPAFIEDPVRLLRAARFAAKLGEWGFRIAHDTHALMKQMARSDELLSLKRQRIWREMRRALCENQPWRFFQVLQRCGALSRLMPSLARQFNETAGHDETGESDPLSALKRVTALTGELKARYVCAVYQAASIFGDNALDLPVERAVREFLTLTLEVENLFPSPLKRDSVQVWAFLEKSRALQQPERFTLLLECCSVLWPHQAAEICDQYRAAVKAVGEVSASVLQAEGFTGAALGERLHARRLEAISAIFS